MYQMYIADEKEIVPFPIPPAKMTIKIKNQNTTVTLINEGEVNLIKSPGLQEISIDELLLPSFQKYPFAVYGDGFHKAKYYLDKLNKWKKSKKPVNFILSRVSPERKLLGDTNMNVTIEDYEIIEDAGQGFDIKVKLNMKQYKVWGVKKLVIKKTKKKASSKTKVSVKKARKAKSIVAEYVVKKGDSLLTIARKQLGDDSKRKKIYELNKKTIEAAAKKHGRKSSSNGFYIYPGTKLKLPK